jgi:hypothetical protein
MMVRRAPVAEAVEWIREMEQRITPKIPITPKAA